VSMGRSERADLAINFENHSHIVASICTTLHVPGVILYSTSNSKYTTPNSYLPASNANTVSGNRPSKLHVEPARIPKQHNLAAFSPSCFQQYIWNGDVHCMEASALQLALHCIITCCIILSCS
jgi:hypothetical protein